MQILNIGRNNSNTIVLNDDMVSRQHAQLIIMNNGQVLIKDLGSTNGTFVNGNRIREYYLKPADILKCAGIFLDWSHYVNGSEAAILQKPLETHADNEFNEAAGFGEFRVFTVRDVIRYLTTRIFNVGDLFRSEWDNKTTILFFLIIPLIGSLPGGLLYYLVVQSNPGIQAEPSLLKIMLPVFVASICCFGFSQLVTMSLFTINRETTLRKNLLAASIFSFLQFLILVVAAAATLLIAQLTDHEGIIQVLLRWQMFAPGSGSWILPLFVYLAAIALVISLSITLVIFIYNYFRSIDVSKGMSIHLTVLSLFVCLAAQIGFAYLIITFIL